jgi:hypothetical protein
MRSARRNLLRGLPALVVGLVACHDASDPDKRRIVGFIEPSRTTPPVIVAPAEVAANQRFTITVHTVGSSACTTPDGGSVVVHEGLVRVVPYDIVPLPGHTDVCLDDQAAHPHLFSLRFPRSGTARLRVVGQRPSGLDEVLDSVETAVIIRP